MGGGGGGGEATPGGRESGRGPFSFGGALGPLVRARAERIRAELPSLDEEAVLPAAAMAEAYPALGHWLNPRDLTSLGRASLASARDVRAYRRAFADGRPPSDLDAEHFQAEIRRFARREKMRIAVRELRVPEVDVTAREISDLAEVCIDLAVREALAWADARFGEPRGAGGERVRYTVLGMGKLGGRELNPGSDVDIVAFYETDDGQAGESSLHEYFARVTQRLSGSLENITEDGSVWRVDLRLRPEGSRGPLVNSLAAAERYYESWGRTWERAALLRARPVGGSTAFGNELLGALGSFVWQRAVKPQIAQEMTELCEMARAELSPDAARDVKLGVGGIREAEFFVQSLQLIWGGRDPSLRTPGTLDALRRLRGRGFVTDREARDVHEGYLFLRKLEHRIQFATGLATHVVPEGELLGRIARSMHIASEAELWRELEKHRKRIAARFASLTRGQAPAPSRTLPRFFAALDAGDEAALTEVVAERVKDHVPVSQDLVRNLMSLARRPDLPLGARTRDLHPSFVSDFTAALFDSSAPEQTARLFSQFFARLVTPQVYVRALEAEPRTLRRMAHLLGASAFLGESLLGHPELVDGVLFHHKLPTEASVRAAVVAAAAEVDPNAEDPADAFVGALRRAKATVTLQVGLSDLAGELDAPQSTSRLLTALAESIVQAALRFALHERARAGGRSLGPEELERGLAIVAMGKLGGHELSYGSDLDLFFVYEDTEDEALIERYVRVAQRVLRLLDLPHGEGPGYALDTRLRPSGNQGLLVVSDTAFARYHGFGSEPRRGEDWERQALIKARFVAGDAGVGARAASVATRAAYERGAPQLDEMLRIRERMNRELSRDKRAAGRFDLKFGPGGLVDVEFAVQWLQMHAGADDRVRTPETEAALEALTTAGVLSATDRDALVARYRLLRRLVERLRVRHGDARSLLERGATALPALARSVGFAGEDDLFEALAEPIPDLGTIAQKTKPPR